MNKTNKFILLLALTLLFAISVVAFAACNDAFDPNEFVTEQGNTIKVVLDSTLDPLIKDKVGQISNGYLDYRLKVGSPIPQPGVTGGTAKPVLDGYVFDGYYQCTVAEDGSVSVSDEKWDFATKVTQDVTLYGKWLIQYKIHVNFVLDGQVQSGQGATVSIVDNAATVESIIEPSWTNHTFIQMYSDKECTQELNVSKAQPFEHGCTQAEPICEVYAKFMEGRWTLVREARDLLSISSNARLFFMNDIDMSSLVGKNGYTDISVTSNFVGTIEGNGHKITNLNFLRQGKNVKPIEYTSYCVGLFAQISNATIRNITFEDCSVSGVIRIKNDQSATSEYYYGFVAGRAVGECTFDNISFVNCKLAELRFDITGITDEEIAAEMKNVTTGFFVGEGSNYKPNVVEQSIATVAQLAASGK